jgi:hypothetical protein
MDQESPKKAQSTTGNDALNAKVLNALREARVRIETLERQRAEPIAIIGMACRLPGGVNSPEDYWRLLKERRDAIVPVPGDRWRMEDYYSPDPEEPGKVNVTGGGFIEIPKAFDAEFFGVAPREAMSLDPQQRLMLEVSWEALERAGLASRKLNGMNVGVFAAICWNDYGQRLFERAPESIDAYMARARQALAYSWPDGPESHGGYRLLVVASRGASGMSELARARVRGGNRRCCQSVAASRAIRELHESPDAVS